MQLLLLIYASSVFFFLCFSPLASGAIVLYESFTSLVFVCIFDTNFHLSFIVRLYVK